MPSPFLFETLTRRRNTKFQLEPAINHRPSLSEIILEKRPKSRVIRISSVSPDPAGPRDYLEWNKESIKGWVKTMTVTRETNDDKTLFRDLLSSREDSAECEEKNTPFSLKRGFR